MINPSSLQQIGKWLFAGLRVLAGILVAKTGIDLLEGDTILGYNRQDTLVIGLFILLIGVYIIFSSLFHVLFAEKNT